MSIAVDLKQKEGPCVVRALCKNADVLIEPFRVGKLQDFATVKSFQVDKVIILRSVLRQSPELEALKLVVIACALLESFQ